MRFYGTLKLNGWLVGKGYGCNKKIVKNVAARLALQSVVPTLYQQWKQKHGGSINRTESGSDSEQSRKSNSLTDILEEVIGDAPASGPSEGRCITSEEEELQAANKGLQLRENLSHQIQQAKQFNQDNSESHQKQQFKDI